MANDLNRWFGNIRLTKDPDLRFTQGGTPVCSFSGASNYSYGKGDQKKEAVSFFNFIAWSKYPGEVIAKHVTKGQRLSVEGRLQQRSWEDKNGQKRNTVEIVIENFQFLEGKGRESESSGGDAASGNILTSGTEQEHAESFESQSPHFSDSDIPF